MCAYKLTIDNGGNHAVERFPLVGMWQHRLMVMYLAVFWMWVLVTTGNPVLMIGAILPVMLLGHELYAIATRRSGSIELRADGIIVRYGAMGSRVPWENIASVEWKESRSNRLVDGALSTIGLGSHWVKIRFRRPVFIWWAIWPRKSLSVPPKDPKSVVYALSARIEAEHGA